MGSVNRVILIGRLGQDPEIKHTSGGKEVCNMSLATEDGKADNKRTEWHRIVAWGKTAVNCDKYLSKGRQVYIEGSLRTRRWQDKNGNDRQTTEVHAYSVVFLDGGKSERQQSSQAGYSQHSQDDNGQDSFDYGPPPMGDDDVPF